MDFLKDMILVVRLTTLMGGIIIVFKNPQLFSSIVNTLVHITGLSFSQYPILGDLSVAWNYFLSSIPWDLKLCRIKSSKNE